MSPKTENTPATFASAKHNAKRKVAGALMVTALTLGGGAGGVAMLNVAHAAEATAAATTQARTESTVNLTAKDFTASAPKETVQNYVNWTLKKDKISPFSGDSTTNYTINVADLVGKGNTVVPGTLLVGIGTLGDDATRVDLPLYAPDEGSTPRSGTLQFGSGLSSTDGSKIMANADGTITISRPDDNKQNITFLYSVEVEGGKTVTQRITIDSGKPTVQAGTFSASTTIGELGTTRDNPTEVAVNDAGKVTFTYTNKSEIAATTAEGNGVDDQKIHLSITRDGKKIALPNVEIAPGETKTFSVEDVAASGTPGEVTGADFKLTEVLIEPMDVIVVAPCDHLAASPIIFKSSGYSEDIAPDFLKLFANGAQERVAPVLPEGVEATLYDAKPYESYIQTYAKGGTCGDETYKSFYGDANFGEAGKQGFGRGGSDNYYSWHSTKENVTDYSVYVKPVAAPVETPAPTPTPDVTPEPTPSETPAPAPSESTPPAPVKPTPEPTPTSPTAIPSVTPSEPAVTPSAEPTPSESVPSAPTQEATTPVPSVSPSEPAVEKPSEPGVKPSEPAKPVEAKTGHEQGSNPVLGAVFAAIAAAGIGGLLFFMRKMRKAQDKTVEAPAEGKDAASEDSDA